MNMIFKDMPIEKLQLSPRSYNCLKRNRIDYINQLLETSDDELSKIRSIGKKSLEELKDVKNKLLDSDDLDSYNEKHNSKIKKNEASSSYLATDIKELNLSLRTYNCLKKVSINTIGDLICYSKEDFKNIPQLGEKSLCEVKNLLKKIEEDFKNIDAMSLKSEDPQYVKYLIISFARKYGEYYKLNPNYIKTLALSIYNNKCLKNQFICRFYEDDVVKKSLKDIILNYLDDNKKGVHISSLYNMLPEHLINTNVVESILIELETEEKIIIKEEVVLKKFISLEEYICKFLNSKEQIIMNMRLNGSTLNDIGDYLGMTRERVRQILNRIIKKIPWLEENKYQELFEKYSFSEYEFVRIFEENGKTYRYLELIVNRGVKAKKPLKDILDDELVSDKIKKRIIPIVFKNYIFINGNKIIKSRPEIFKFIVKSECKEKRSFDDVLNLYQDFLTEQGLQDDEKLHIEKGTYENKMQLCDYALWNWNHSLRYYDIPSLNYEELVEEIDLKQYWNLEISTLKLFREHPDLMKEFDIRDEYELHNLLKKIWNQYGNVEVTFSKMPTIRLGDCDRDKQALDLLMSCSPIGKSEYAARFEDEFGLKATIGMSFPSIDVYLNEDDMYVIEQEELPSEQYEKMKSILMKDFYSRDEIRRLYSREFPNCDVNNINAFNLKKLGFLVFSKYVIKNTYRNASEYFRKILTTKDIVDTSEFSYYMNEFVSTYTVELYDLKEKREIIEFSPKKYINIRRLQEKGINKKDFEEYCDNVYRFVGEDNYFTITSIRNDGFEHPIDDLYFDEWFYSSILIEDREHFSYRRLGDVKLIYSKGGRNIVFSDFLEWVVQQQESIDIYDLAELLKSQYGINIGKDDIKYDLKQTALYYNEIMERVYVDYETYFEEI